MPATATDRLTFEVYECGDPYSRAWDVSERTEHGTIYRGDISGLHRKRGLVAYLRRTYPGCRVVARYP